MATRVSRSDRDDRDEEPRGRGRDREEDRYDDEPPRSSRGSRRTARDEDEDRPRRGRDRDEEEDRPRGRDRDDRDEDRPRRSRRDEEDEPRGRTRSRDDEDEPRGRTRGRGRDEDDEPRGRTRSGRDDRDDEPRGRTRGRGRDDADEGVGSGWAGSHKQREKARTTEQYNLPDPDKQEANGLVKCLEDEPFASVGVHWVDTPKGRKPFNCPGSDDCRLCDAGHAPTAYDFFNIAYLGPDDRWKNAYIKAGIGLSKILETANDARSGPLSKPYYEVNQLGGRGNKSGPPNWKWDVVRERDLDEEWKTDPLTDDEFDELYAKRFHKSDVFRPAGEDELRAAARDLRDRD